MCKAQAKIGYLSKDCVSSVKFATWMGSKVYLLVLYFHFVQ